MSVETVQVSAEVLNAAFIHKLDSGLTKEAMEAGSAFIRQKLYEEGVTRRLFDFRTVTADELDPTEDDDKPSILVEKEPDSPLATFVPFRGTGDHRYFSGKRFRIPFGKIESTREAKSKFELMVIRMDIMTWLKDKHVKMVQAQEDSALINACDAIVKANSGAQDLDVTLSSTVSFKDAITTGVKALYNLRLPCGKILMHKNTYIDSSKLKTDEIGFKPQEDRFNNGLEGETSFLGYPVVTTIKEDIVAPGEIYFFAPQDYFARAYLLQDATLFIKNEADMIEFFTYEAPGIGIGNTHGVVRVTVADDASA